MQNKYDIIIVGGGFFGANVALHYAQRGKRVLIVEREHALMKRASLNNQARVHGGYHYPRSILTGLRSRENYGIFLDRFSNCIEKSFEKYYALSSRFSNVTANQFSLFCQRIGAPLKEAPPKIKKLFNPMMVETVYEVEECAFNASVLAEEMEKKLERVGVDVLLRSEVRKISEGLKVKIHSNDTEIELKTDQVFLCIYSDLNRVLSASGLPLIALRQELTEIALIEPPAEIMGLGITVMCGPFFSLMPYPARQLYSFSHVRYTPHFSWEEANGQKEKLPEVNRGGETHFKFMLKDSQRYLPALEKTKYVDSLWEIKTTLPRCEGDDARPVLFKENHALRGLHCIIGAKINNIFDVIKRIEGV